MMIKFVCLLVIFIGVSYIGISLSINYSKRERFFNELISFCNVLFNNIKFNKSKLKVVIKENLDNYKTELKDYLQNYLENKEVKISLLTEYENSKVNEFFVSIGKLDSFGELNNIENYKIIFNEFYNDCKLNNKKYGNLYSKLGVIFALILVILFI